MDKSFNAYIENSIRDNCPQNRKDAYPDGGGRHKKRR